MRDEWWGIVTDTKMGMPVVLMTGLKRSIRMENRKKNQNRTIFEAVLRQMTTNDVRVTGEQLYLDCPVCNDVGQHLQVRMTDGLYICFRCRAGGTLKHHIGREPTRWKTIRNQAVFSDAPSAHGKVSSLVSERLTPILGQC